MDDNETWEIAREVSSAHRRVPDLRGIWGRAFSHIHKAEERELSGEVKGRALARLRDYIEPALKLLRDQLTEPVVKAVARARSAVEQHPLTLRAYLDAIWELRKLRENNFSCHGLFWRYQVEDYFWAVVSEGRLVCHVDRLPKLSHWKCADHLEKLREYLNLKSHLFSVRTVYFEQRVVDALTEQLKRMRELPDRAQEVAAIENDLSFLQSSGELALPR